MTLVITQKCDACTKTREIPLRSRGMLLSTVSDGMKDGGWRPVPNSRKDEDLCPECVESIVEALAAFNKK